MTTSSAATSRPLPFWLCVGWGLGTLGIAIMFNSTNILVLRFMTDQLGIAAAVGGFLVGLSKAYDACMDPVIGGISDRTRSRWGRRRPYLLWGAFGCAAVMVLLFDVPQIADARLMTLYMAMALILFATAYATFNVPYLAMPAEMTDDYHGRSYLMSFRVYAVAIGQSVGGFLGPYLISTRADNPREGYSLMAWVLGGLTLAACLACFFMTRTARFTARHEGKHVPVWEQFKLAWSNRPFMMLMGAKLCQLIGVAIVQGTMAYFTLRVLKVSDAALGVMALVQTFGIIVTVPLWVRFSRHYGKRATFITSVVLYSVFMATWLFSGPDESLWLVYGRGFLSGFGVSGMLLMGASMLPDTMEYDYRRTGLRREGIFSGIYTTIEKVAFALGVTVLGVFLGAMGYVESTGAAVEQPQSAITAIYLCIGLGPLVSGLLSCAFIWRYDLSEAKLKSEPAVA